MVDKNTGELVARRYRLEEKVGRGGYGTVFGARDVELDRTVAIKIVRMADFTDSKARSAEIRRRFRQEARAAARVRHPNIVTIYDVGETETGEELYIVMELLEGNSLAEEIDQHGRIPLSRAKLLFVPCLRGLAAAHEAGIVHKDLKPTNLILDQPRTSAESLQIIDFGVARLLGDSEQQTATGKMAGTPRYSAPEYIMGDEVTPAVDVYQMGLILAEALSGFPAVPSGLDPRATVQRHLGGVLDLAEEVVDSPVGAVLARALAAEPGERFKDAAMFADALDTIDVSEWQYDADSTPNFTPRTYTPSGSISPAGEFTPSGSFTPVGSRSRPPSGVEHGPADLADTKLDQPSHAESSSSGEAELPAEPNEPAAPVSLPESGETTGWSGAGRTTRSGSALARLAPLVLLSITILAGLYIYRTTGGQQPDVASPPSGAKAPLVAGERECVWQPRACEIDCVIDAEKQTDDCPDEISVEFAEEGRARAQIEMPSARHTLSVITDFCDLDGWAFHVADSATCNGGGGDAGTSEHNAELQVVRGDVSLFAADPDESSVMLSRSYPGFLPREGCDTRGFHFADQLVAVDGMCNRQMGEFLRLDPPSDREGVPDRMWYLALNTTYLESQRHGRGARRARVCIYEDFPVLAGEEP